MIHPQSAKEPLGDLLTITFEVGAGGISTILNID